MPSMRVWEREEFVGEQVKLKETMNRSKRRKKWREWDEGAGLAALEIILHLKATNLR